MEIWQLLYEIVILLSGALLLGAVFSRFGQSPLIGYLLAGMLLGGPGSIHAVRSEQEIEAIAELGVSLLLFSLGLEFSISRLKKLGNKALVGGILQVVLTLMVMTLAAFLYGLGWIESFGVGAMVCLSSTAVVLRTLMERGELETAHGGNSLAVLLVQDMAVVPLAVLIALMAGGEGTREMALNVGRILLLAGLLIAGLHVLLNHVAVRVLGALTLERNRELTVILAVVTGLGSAWAAHWAGISPALGAFVAGMFLGSSPFATQIRADISSLRIVLLTLFFGAAGMVADPIWIIENGLRVAGVTVGLMLIKLVVVWCIFQALRQPASVAATTGVCISQVGEFAFVLGSVARSANVISTETQTLIVSTAIVTLFLSPYLIARAPHIGFRLATLLPGVRAGTPPSEGEVTATDHVIIIGFGPAGQIAAASLVDSPFRPTVIDLNQEGVRKADALGFHGRIGDATQLDVLEAAHVTQAKAVVVTVPHHQTASTIVEIVRRMAPLAHVVVRSRYQLNVNDFVAAGAHVVFGDEEEIGMRLGQHLQQWLSSHVEIKPQTESAGETEAETTDTGGHSTEQPAADGQIGPPAGETLRDG